MEPEIFETVIGNGAGGVPPEPPVPPVPPDPPDPGAGVTERVTLLLVTLPTALLTSTEKIEPSSPATVAGVVNEADVAPTIGEPFLLH
jgi:hypothetical protein